MGCTPAPSGSAASYLCHVMLTCDVPMTRRNHDRPGRDYICDHSSLSMKVSPYATTTSTTTTITTTESQTLLDMKDELKTLKELLQGGDQQNAETIKTEMLTIENALVTITAEARSLREVVAEQAERIDALVSEQNRAAEVAAEATLNLKNEAQVNMDALRDEVAGVMAFFTGEIELGQPTGVAGRCKSSTGTCVPEVSADGAGTLTLQALSGKVQFETDECGTTDLCEIAMQLQVLVDKFKNEGP